MEDGRHERDDDRDLEDGVGVERLPEEIPRSESREADRERDLLVPSELGRSVVPKHHEERHGAGECVHDSNRGLHQVTTQGCVGEGVQDRCEDPERPGGLARCALLVDRLPVVLPERREEGYELDDSDHLFDGQCSDVHLTPPGRYGFSSSVRATPGRCCSPSRTGSRSGRQNAHDRPDDADAIE